MSAIVVAILTVAIVVTVIFLARKGQPTTPSRPSIVPTLFPVPSLRPLPSPSPIPSLQPSPIPSLQPSPIEPTTRPRYLPTARPSLSPATQPPTTRPPILPPTKYPPTTYPPTTQPPALLPTTRPPTLPPTLLPTTQPPSLPPTLPPTLPIKMKYEMWSTAKKATEYDPPVISKPGQWVVDTSDRSYLVVDGKVTGVYSQQASPSGNILRQRDGKEVGQVTPVGWASRINVDGMSPQFWVTSATGDISTQDQYQDPNKKVLDPVGTLYQIASASYNKIKFVPANQSIVLAGQSCPPNYSVFQTAFLPSYTGGRQDTYMFLPKSSPSIPMSYTFFVDQWGNGNFMSSSDYVTPVYQVKIDGLEPFYIINQHQS